MQDAAIDNETRTQILIWSDRLLFADSLSHHFANTSPHFIVLKDRSLPVAATVPTVCLRDVGLQTHSAPEQSAVVAEVLAKAPLARVLIVSGRADVTVASDWLAAGAHGYFSTRSSCDLLTAAASVVAAGGLYIPESLARSVLLGDAPDRG
jgi:DNA-binding NarL/FixJ family response regulator